MDVILLLVSTQNSKGPGFLIVILFQLAVSFIGVEIEFGRVEWDDLRTGTSIKLGIWDFGVSIRVLTVFG